MANLSGLGSKELWVSMDDVKKTFAGYAAAHAHYVQVSNSAVAGPGWDGLDWAYSPVKSDVDIEAAKPFLRFVIERMLALLESDESWIKGQATAWNHNAKREQFCLIGALGRAAAELGLALGNDGFTELNTARNKTLRAIEAFFAQAVKEDTGHTNMPSFNDAPSTTFEDVRLWLKGLFDRLD
jgi:hypothetical protein